MKLSLHSAKISGKVQLDYAKHPCKSAAKHTQTIQNMLLRTFFIYPQSIWYWLPLKIQLLSYFCFSPY